MTIWARCSAAMQQQRRWWRQQQQQRVHAQGGLDRPATSFEGEEVTERRAVDAFEGRRGGGTDFCSGDYPGKEPAVPRLGFRILRFRRGRPLEASCEGAATPCRRRRASWPPAACADFQRGTATVASLRCIWARNLYIGQEFIYIVIEP